MTNATHTNPESFEPSEWVNQAEAARLRGVSRQAIAKLAANGRLKTLAVGGRTFVSRADVLAFVPNPPGRPRMTPDE
ncbi:MAG: helix-turn-helix domain-containing protein [Pseudomonadota bacterium]